MGSVAFSTVFLFLPTLAEKMVEFQFGLAASSLMMEFQLIPDFDNESNYAPRAPRIWTETLTSQDAKSRTAALDYFSGYLSMKHASEAGNDFKATSKMLRKSLGKHLNPVIAG